MLGNHPEGTDVNDENKMTAHAVSEIGLSSIKRLSPGTGDSQTTGTAIS